MHQLDLSEGGMAFSGSVLQPEILDPQGQAVQRWCFGRPGGHHLTGARVGAHPRSRRRSVTGCRRTRERAQSRTDERAHFLTYRGLIVGSLLPA
ncbi:hypothetical protein, partial [Streptomyces sp. NPDC094468]|uniref:hypothetical protein n=1 Tax=Streptomyces sp. NPDC094468 TaxID=3366066 RepID=UPI0037FBB7A3